MLSEKKQQRVRSSAKQVNRAVCPSLFFSYDVRDGVRNGDGMVGANNAARAQLGCADVD
jgi:hypothetical protein